MIALILILLIPAFALALTDRRGKDRAALLMGGLLFWVGALVLGPKLFPPLLHALQAHADGITTALYWIAGLLVGIPVVLLAGLVVATIPLEIRDKLADLRDRRLADAIARQELADREAARLAAERRARDAELEHDTSGGFRAIVPVGWNPDHCPRCAAAAKQEEGR